MPVLRITVNGKQLDLTRPWSRNILRPTNYYRYRGLRTKDRPVIQHDERPGPVKIYTEEEIKEFERLRKEGKI